MFIKFLILCIDLCFSLIAASVEQNFSLIGQWQFTLDKKAQGKQELWFLPQHDRANWRKVNVPNTWNIKLGNERYYGIA